MLVRPHARGRCVLSIQEDTPTPQNNPEATGCLLPRTPLILSIHPATHDKATNLVRGSIASPVKGGFTLLHSVRSHHTPRSPASNRRGFLASKQLHHMVGTTGMSMPNTLAMAMIAVMMMATSWRFCVGVMVMLLCN